MKKGACSPLRSSAMLDALLRWTGWERTALSAKAVTVHLLDGLPQAEPFPAAPEEGQLEMLLCREGGLTLELYGGRRRWDTAASASSPQPSSPATGWDPASIGGPREKCLFPSFLIRKEMKRTRCAVIEVPGGAPGPAGCPEGLLLPGQGPGRAGAGPQQPGAQPGL